MEYLTSAAGNARKGSRPVREPGQPSSAATLARVADERCIKAVASHMQRATGAVAKEELARSTPPLSPPAHCLEVLTHNCLKPFEVCSGKWV